MPQKSIGFYFFYFACPEKNYKCEQHVVLIPKLLIYSVADLLKLKETLNIIKNDSVVYLSWALSSLGFPRNFP